MIFFFIKEHVETKKERDSSWTHTLDKMWGSKENTNSDKWYLSLNNQGMGDGFCVELASSIHDLSSCMIVLL